MQSQLANSTTTSLEVLFLPADEQEKFTAECTWMPFKFEGFMATVLIARDISERKKHQNLTIATDRLKSLGQLAAGVGHEINNPLCYVMMKLELINTQLENKISPELKDHLADINQGLVRIQTIVQDLKTLSRENVNDELAPSQVSSTLQSALSLANHQIRQKAILEISLAEVPAVNVNQTQLSQVFLNLLMNAVQSFTDNDLAKNKIELKTYLDGIHVGISISDTGCGIAENIKKNIFKPFFTTKAPGEGTGLGLSICHSVIHRFGGSIHFESKINVGTTFTILLPAVKNRVIPVPVELPKQSSNTSARAKVLLIDDDAILLETMAEIIEAMHDPVAVSDATAALVRIQSGEKFDAILCDLMMPNIDGTEFYESLQKISPLHCLRTVFLTGGSFTDRSDAFLRQTGISHLQKPVLSHELFSTIQQIVARASTDQIE